MLYFLLHFVNLGDAIFKFSALVAMHIKVSLLNLTFFASFGFDLCSSMLNVFVPPF